MVLRRTLAGCLGSGIVFLLLSGCASFRGDNLPVAGKLSALSNKADRLSAGYLFTSGVDMLEKAEHPDSVRVPLEQEFVKVLKESGCFSSIAAGNEGDVIIQASLVNSGSPAAVIFPAILTGLSLYIIPSWATDNYDVNVKVTTKTGGEFTYQITDSVVTVQWLPMIFFARKKALDDISREVRLNVWRNLIIKMRQDGLFPAAQPTSSDTIHQASMSH